MIIGHGSDASIIQETINILDDEDIDFLFIGTREIKTKIAFRKLNFTFHL